jgi:Ca-activated chloride channel family protein
MRTHRSPRKISEQRRGSVIPMVAVMLPVTLGMSAFALNIAYLELNRTEMYVAADAAARAAGREFALQWDQKKAVEAGKAAGMRNPVGGKPFELIDSDFVFGEAVRANANSRYTFTRGGTSPNAVEVDVRRVKGSANGAIGSLVTFGGFSHDVDATISSRANQAEADICLVIDRSGSMAYASNEKAVATANPKSAHPDWWWGDNAPPSSRWRDLTSSVDVFVNEMRKTPMKENVALVTYSSSSGADVGLVSDYALINSGLNKYTKSFPGGSTAIASGIKTGQTVLSGASARVFSMKIMVLMTDGINNAGSSVTAAAEEAKKNNIMIFTITFSDEADQKSMKEVASIGLGKHYHAKNASDLENIFREISRQIPVLISK